MSDKKELDLDSVLKILDAIADVVGAVAEIGVSLKDKYGFIHKQAFINYHGKEGRLVWDYLLVNELTFEDRETGAQYSLGISASDKKTEEFFDDLVKQYVI